MKESLEGRKVLVTGASRGLGEALVRAFADEGCKVVLNYAHNDSAARKIADETGATCWKCDISDENAVKAMFDEAGPIDILVNNARIDPYARPADASDGDWWDAVMSVNLKGAYLCGKFALEQMKARSWGRIIHISSLWAYQPANERMLAYASAKSAMHALSRGLARLGAPHGVTSNVVAPGLILTDMLTKRLTPEMLQNELSGIPLGRGATPAEISQFVIDVASTPFLTGEILNLNGGAFMAP